MYITKDDIDFIRCEVNRMGDPAYSNKYNDDTPIIHYANLLLDSLEELIDDSAEFIAKCDNITTAMLCGAKDWREYSYGGCAYIYNDDIAKLIPQSFRRR